MCSADSWSVIASPFLPKYLSSPRCAALNGALYLIGDNTKKVYVYDPGANLWQKVSHPRSPTVCPLVEPCWTPDTSEMQQNRESQRGQQRAEASLSRL